MTKQLTTWVPKFLKLIPSGTLRSTNSPCSPTLELDSVSISIMSSLMDLPIYLLSRLYADDDGLSSSCGRKLEVSRGGGRGDLGDRASVFIRGASAFEGTNNGGVESSGEGGIDVLGVVGEGRDETSE